MSKSAASSSLSTPAGLAAEAVSGSRSVGGGFGGSQVTVFVEKRADNTPEAADGRKSVTLKCSTRSGRTAIRAKQVWPFGDTDGGQFGPHVHEAAPAHLAPGIDRCVLEGTKGPLEGRVGRSTGGTG
jgi:hypothetical protein